MALDLTEAAGRAASIASPIVRAAISANPVLSAIMAAVEAAVPRIIDQNVRPAVREAQQLPANAPLPAAVTERVDPNEIARKVMEAIVQRPEFQAAKPATDSLPWYSSPTTWTPVVGLLGLVVSGFGWQLAPEQYSALTAYLSATASGAVLIYGWIKRVRSKTQPVVATAGEAGSSRQS